MHGRGPLLLTQEAVKLVFDLFFLRVELLSQIGYPLRTTHFAIHVPLLAQDAVFRVEIAHLRPDRFNPCLDEVNLVLGLLESDLLQLRNLVSFEDWILHVLVRQSIIVGEV